MRKINENDKPRISICGWSKYNVTYAYYADIIDVCTLEMVSMSPSTHYRSFLRRVFPVNHLHWY